MSLVISAIGVQFARFGVNQTHGPGIGGYGVGWMRNSACVRVGARAKMMEDLQGLVERYGWVADRDVLANSGEDSMDWIGTRVHPS